MTKAKLHGKNMTIKQIISIDIGATKCAAAVVSYNQATGESKLNCDTRVIIRECESIFELFAKLEAGLNYKLSGACAVCIAAAGQYDGTRINLERGYPYPMEIAAVAKQFAIKQLAVVHDYVPVACSTFTNYCQNSDNVITINKGQQQPLERRVVFGVGTGLGMKDCCLLPNNDFWLGQNEGGHIGIAIPSLDYQDDLQRHCEFMNYLVKEKIIENDSTVTFESILSGKGLARIHHFHENTNIADFSQQNCPSQMTLNQETWGLFAWYLGLFTATVQLLMMPRGGIWICGGVIQKNFDVFDLDDFKRGIDNAKAYRDIRDEFPLYALKGLDHVYHGGAYYASHRLLKSESLPAL